jgi:hypothetical protein
MYVMYMVDFIYGRSAARRVVDNGGNDAFGGTKNLKVRVGGWVGGWV